MRFEKNRALMLRLDTWGDWERHSVIGLDYPKETIIARLMELGGIYSDGTPQSRSLNYKPSPKCSEVSRHVQDLPKKQNAAIWGKHVLALKKDEIYAACGYGLRQYNRYLRLSYQMLASKLEYSYIK